MPHPRCHRVFALLSACCLLVGNAWAVQPQIAVITAPDAPHLTLDHDTLRNVYLKRVFVDGRGQRVTPVNLPPGSPLRDAFSRAIVHMEDAQLQQYWDRQYFQGVSPPYVLGSQDAVVRFVAVTPGAIGYVATCHVDTSVHVAFVIILPPQAVDDISGCTDHGTP